MGFSFHGHKRDVDAEKHLKRLHHTTPLIESPLVGADHENLVFSQRHEANSIELFFDLFFVANLATFTAYHSITDYDYLLGYIGFFGILWSCWFQITLHDVRFARDSLYERACKVIQFIVFVGLALVGSQFNPASHTGKGNNTNFRILCYTLIISRGLLAIQYLVVLFYTWRARYSKIYLPLGLMVGIYAISMAAFAGMTPAFRAEDHSHRLVYLVWYVVMVLEAIAVVTISCCWRILSFKKTHLMERMSLLTIIVIGEGAIGVTKTVSRIMGKHGLDVEGCFLIMCIIVILVFIWALYFDKFPHGHYGTIRQQIWSLLHFPFQLAIVGVVEGSQQLALARYVNKSADKVTKSIIQYCQTENLDGQKLQDKLMDLLVYFELDSKFETKGFYMVVEEAIWNIGNATGICSSENAAEYNVDNGNWPDDFVTVDMGISNGMYTGLGMKVPVDKLEEYTPLEVAVQGWRLVYVYYWSSFCLLLVCLILFLFLIRRHKSDLFDFTSVISRLIVLGIGGAMMALMANNVRLYNALSSPALLPICVVLLLLILVIDKLSSVWCNWRLKKSGQPYALEYEEHGHHDRPSSGHGEIHETGPLHGHVPHDSISGMEDLRKSARWSTHSDSMPLTASTEYHSPGHENYAMTPLMSPPLLSPDPVAPLHSHTPAPGGYMPVSSGQHYGA
ncbi:Nn.00g093400.m01.CDS01 [Neocucurbitaria sp. VM-36]